MSKVIRLSQNLVMNARRVERIEGRLPFQQIEHWTRLGKLAENNFELTGKRLLDILNTQSPEL